MKGFATGKGQSKHADQIRGQGADLIVDLCRGCHLLETLRTGYGLSVKDAKAVLSDRVEHFKKIIFEHFDMTEEYYNEVIKNNME